MPKKQRLPKQLKPVFALVILLTFLAYCFFASQVSATPTISLTLNRIDGYSLGSDINGQFTLNAQVSSDVTRVEFYLNGTLQDNDTSSPFSWSFNTNSYALGEYNITAVAYDSSGQQATATLSQIFVETPAWANLLTIVSVVIVIVIVVVIVVLVLRNRGKQLKCPDCGQVFKAPAMDEKVMGFGSAIPGMGNVTCPNCGAKRRRKDYETVQQQKGT